MKRLFFTLALICASLGAVAQTDQTVSFELQPDGTFKTAEGKDFVILNFNDKKAPELYQMFLAAAFKGFQTEHRTTSQVENVAFAVEGITDTLSLRGAGTVVMQHAFQIMFHFKDERVKVDAPVLTKAYACMMVFGRCDKFYEQDSTFKEWVQNGSAFLKFKDGVPSKEKFMRNWIVINKKTNELINCVLRQLQSASEDW